MFLSMQIDWKHYLKFRPKQLTLTKRYCIDYPDKPIDAGNHSNI